MTSEIVSASIKRLMGAKRKLQHDRPHVCYPSVCNPENEPALSLDAPLTDHVFLCDYRVVHVCDEEHCERYLDDGTGTCPISGRNYGRNAQPRVDYDRNDSRTWEASKRQRKDFIRVRTTQTTIKKQLFRVPDQDNVKGRVRELVHVLLFSPKRKSVLDALYRKHLERRNHARDDYIRGCRIAHQLQFLTDLMRIHTYFMTYEAPLQLIPYDEQLETYYVEIVWQVWLRVNTFIVPNSRPKKVSLPQERSNVKLSVECIALGTLYFMKHGYVLDDLELLPIDTFLQTALPQISDLVHFGIYKRLITDGEKLITQSYQNAISQGARLELPIDYSGLRETRLVHDGEEQDATLRFFALGKERPKGNASL
jgi:hypothetical protein